MDCPLLSATVLAFDTNEAIITNSTQFVQFIAYLEGAYHRETFLPHMQNNISSEVDKHTPLMNIQTLRYLIDEETSPVKFCSIQFIRVSTVLLKANHIHRRWKLLICIYHSW